MRKECADCDGFHNPLFSGLLATMPQPYETIRESVREIGPLFPLYKYQGRTIDGEKRARACSETGRRIAVCDISDERTAAALLWRLHPERALELFPSSCATDAARRYSARLVEVSPHFQPPPRAYPPRKRTGARSRNTQLTESPVQMNVRVGQELRNKVKEAAQSVGLKESEYLRGALVVANQDPERVRAVLIALSIVGRK